MTNLYIHCLLLSLILTTREKNEHKAAEIILAWQNMWNYLNLCVAHARLESDLLSYEYY